MGSESQRQTRKRRGQVNYRLVRYADDYVIIVAGEKEHAEVLRERLADLLAPMGLRLSAKRPRPRAWCNSSRVTRERDLHRC